MNCIKKIGIWVIGWLAVMPASNAQDAVAITSDPGPSLHVALNWWPATQAVRYNVYRKGDTDPSYPSTPLNATPVQPANNCFTIQTLLINTPDSALWNKVAYGLADSVLFDPCQLNTIPRPSEKHERLLLMTRSYMPVAIAAGLGFIDNTVSVNNRYHYKIEGLDASNNVVNIIATDLLVVAGVPTSLIPPTGIVAEPGDASVLVRWNTVAGVAGYVLERSTNPAFLFRQVNESQYSTQVHNHLNGDTLIPAAAGMLDFQRYDTITGKPALHKVGTVWIAGPRNGITYYYRVRSIDLFGRRSAPSTVSNAVTPADSTKPSAPLDLVATPDNNTAQINIQWTQVVKDINGHWEQPDSSVRYRIYRFASSADPLTTPSVYLGIAGPLKGIRTKDTTDKDPSLRAAFGNRTWWYRVRAEDTTGNLSQWSSAVSAIIKDNTPPDIVHGVAATGFDTSISVKWNLNTEPDMSSYMVYRSLCHLGSWVPCNRGDTCKEWVNYNPNATYPNTDQPTHTLTHSHTPIGAAPTAAAANPGGPKLPCPCSGPFVFLGEITQDSARRAMTAGHFFFNDLTIPAGSPLCYAYWIKAKDSSDNMSGDFPLPSAAERAEIVCQRLRDLTPPEPALIAGLFAQADQIRIEWMGPPTQDTRAYHVYRATGTDPAKEPLPAAFVWVGGTTIELPPALPVTLTTPYKPPGLAPCDRISVQATPWMSQGSFVDKTTDPKLTYWYRVVGIDYDGNETPLNKSAAISTFTFTRKTPPTPVLDVIAKQANPCAVMLQWSPVFNPTLHKGFIVYRSSTATGPFLPIVVSPLKTNAFTDSGVINGQIYWYRLGVLMSNGRLSELTTAQSIIP